MEESSSHDTTKPISELETENTDVPLEKAMTDVSKTDLKSDTTAETDPYAYLNRNEFSSEKFKIEIMNLPKYFGIGQFKKFLNKMGISAHKLKPIGRFVFVSFCNEEERQNAMTKLQGAKYKGQVLEVKLAKAMQDPLIKKRKLEAEQNRETRIKLDASAEELVKKATLPYADESYEKQLEMKRNKMELILKKLTSEIRKANYKIKPHINTQMEKNNGLLCPLMDVVPSPVTEEYRNKCDFTVGINPDTDKLTVGFRISSYKEGSNGVGPIYNLAHLPKLMKDAVQLFENYFRESERKPFDPVDHSGYWRQVTIRSTVSNEVMAIVVMHPQNLNEEEIEIVKFELKNLVEKSNLVTSLYFQKLSIKKSNEEEPVVHLYGSSHICEKLCGLEFSISPQAFFQINTLGAEILYNQVSELAEIDSDSTVLDVCCGTGTIGLSMAKKCHQVLGVELISSAVEDAKKNAEVNNITNSTFIAGRAEDLLSNLIEQIGPDGKVVAVLDPPRAGLHQRCCQLLRKTERIQHLVYVSCNAEAAMKSFVDLSRAESNTYKGKPFVPVKAIPVDLFPHTPHCELILVFERLQ